MVIGNATPWIEHIHEKLGSGRLSFKKNAMKLGMIYMIQLEDWGIALFKTPNSRYLNCQVVIFCKDSLNPVGSMYGLFIYICYKEQLNVVK